MNISIFRGLPGVALLLCAGLLFVWPLPGTIALRYLLLLLAGIAVFAASCNRRVDLRRQLPLVAVLVALSLWFLIQALAISAETPWALGELRGQWLPAIAACAIGMLLAAGVDSQDRPAALAVLAASLLLLVVLGIGQSLWHFVRFHQLLRMEVPLTRGHLEMSVVINTLLSILLSDVLCRIVVGRRLLPIGLPWLVFALVCALVESYLANARNGLIGTVFIVILAAALALREPRAKRALQRRKHAVLLATAAIAAIATVTLMRDERWHFLDTVPVAWDIRNNTAWLSENRPMPRLPDGSTVEASAYVRIAFIHAGLELMAGNPLGVGYGRNAFDHALVRAYPDADVGHAHSGWIDLGVGTGLPGVLLWLGLSVVLLRTGWLGWRNGHNGFALVLLVMTSEYSLRMLLDSVNRDHMLQTFMFLVGYLSGMAASEELHGASFDRFPAPDESVQNNRSPIG